MLSLFLQVSEFPVVFEERSDYSSGSLNLTSTALMDGVYCIFGGCYRTSESQTFSELFPNITCGTSVVVVVACIQRIIVMLSTIKN